MVDLLAVCAHPDDLEAGLGGMFLKANLEGLCTGLIVFTKGESGGYTDKETRVREATEAAKILQLDYFKLLDFPDAGLYYEKAAVKALIPLLRECAPRYVFTMLQEDYHPDHVAVSRITENAAEADQYFRDKAEVFVREYEDIKELLTTGSTYISCDYGTQNPCVFKMWQKGKNVCVLRMARKIYYRWQ